MASIAGAVPLPVWKHSDGTRSSKEHTQAQVDALSHNTREHVDPVLDAALRVLVLTRPPVAQLSQALKDILSGTPSLTQAIDSSGPIDIASGSDREGIEEYMGSVQPVLEVLAEQLVMSRPASQDAARATLLALVSK